MLGAADGMLSTASAVSQRNDSKASAFRRRADRQFALDEVRKFRASALLQGKMDAAAHRANMIKSASSEQLVEAGRQRDVLIARANAEKNEREARRNMAALTAHEARERERVLKMRRVEEEKAREKEGIVKHNQAESDKRQVMLEQVAAREYEMRARLASDIVSHDMAGRLRKRDIAEQRDAMIQTKAIETENTLRRAQSAKALREAVVIERIKASAADKAAARDLRIAKVHAIRENERLQYAQRNAEEEARRVRALEAVQRKEAEVQMRLASDVAHAAQAARQRYSTSQVGRLREVADHAAQRAKQQQRAVDAKATKERREREIQLAAAAVMEKKRVAQAQRAAERKEAQRLYYVERNILQESKYEQHAQSVVDAELGGVATIAAAASLGGLSRAASAALGLSQTAPPVPTSGTRSPERSERWAEDARAARTLASSASNRSFTWLLDA